MGRWTGLDYLNTGSRAKPRADSRGEAYKCIWRMVLFLRRLLLCGIPWATVEVWSRLSWHSWATAFGAKRSFLATKGWLWPFETTHLQP